MQKGLDQDVQGVPRYVQGDRIDRVKADDS